MLSVSRSLVMMLLVICISSACSTAQQPSGNVQTKAEDKKILIVYLSRTGNTRAVAEMIRQKVGGELVGLEVEKPYPADYQTTVRQVARENDTGYLPPLKTKIDGIDDYDVVFLGFPTWDMQLPPPMKSFLRKYDLSGKIVIPFNTNAGYGEGSSFSTVRELAAKSKVLNGIVIKGGIERDGQLFVIKDRRAVEVSRELETWLKSLGIFSDLK